jgi:pSer/pThr/pTyr-binding forkhead associated (FHA) protein
MVKLGASVCCGVKSEKAGQTPGPFGPREAGQTLAKLAFPMYELEAMNGPLDGKRWAFSRDITIGRDGEVVGAALPTDRAASRRHAEISAGPDGVIVTDLDSRNGTLVGDSAIEGPARIAFGRSFVVGRTMLRVLDPDATEKA